MFQYFSDPPPPNPLFHTAYRPIQKGKQQTIWGHNGTPSTLMGSWSRRFKSSHLD